jgi:hypothetical protein
MVQGDIIVCIYDVPKVATVGKQYVAIYVYDEKWYTDMTGLFPSDNTDQVCIDCDNGHRQVLNCSVFLTLEEYRNKKLKDIDI